MVALASPVITVIVRDLAGQKTYSAVHDYGAAGDGVTVDDAAFEQFQTDWSASSGPFVLYLPAGEYVVGSPANRFLSGFSNITLRGVTETGDVWTSEMSDLTVSTPGVIVEDYLHSVRIEAASQGALTVTVKNRDVSGTGRTLTQLMNLFSVGQWVLIAAIDTQGYGYPPNAAFSEYRQIASKGVNTLTFTEALSRSYSDSYPEYYTGSAFDADQGGPATIYALLDAFDSSVEISNVQLNGPAQSVFGAKEIVLRNCNVVSDFWPSVSSSIRVIGGQCDFVESDKVYNYLEFEGASIGQLAMQSQQPARAVIRNSTIATLNGTNQSMLCEDTSITSGFSMGVGGYGATLDLTFTNCTFPSTFQFSNRPFSVAGCTFTGSGVSGYRMGFASRTGTPTVGQTLTGGSSGATATIAEYSNGAANLSGISGIFTKGESVSTASMTAVNDGNSFGREWAIPGALVMFQSQTALCAVTARVVSFATSGQHNLVTTDLSSWPSYSDNPLTYVRVHPCPDLTMTGCTGNDTVVAWSQAPANFTPGAWARYWLSASGVVAPASLMCFGRIVSITVNVTRAYAGALSNLYLTLGSSGASGLVLPGGTWGSLNIRVNLKITGQRVYSPSGDTGLDASDVTGDTNFVMSANQSGGTFYFSPTLLDAKTGGSPATISGESSSVWPEFTMTIVTEI